MERYIGASLRRFADFHHYGYSHRVKDLDSTSEKLESGRYPSWDSLDDLVAFTIVVPTSTHEPAVVEFLRETYDEREFRSKYSTAKPPDQFRFDATRWYGQIRSDEPLPDLELRAFSIQFEVQIPTAFENAWSVVTHDLVYKGDDVDWRKRRLAAQLKAQVEQIDVTVENFEEVSANYPASGWAETDAMSHAVTELKRLIADGAIDESLMPSSWTRFCENMIGLSSTVSRQRGARAGAFMTELIDQFVTAVRDETFRVSLSAPLFLALVAFLLRRGDDLGRFPVPGSAELLAQYGVEAPRRVQL
jgi:hypothetical protein